MDEATEAAETAAGWVLVRLPKSDVELCDAGAEGSAVDG